MATEKKNLSGKAKELRDAYAALLDDLSTIVVGQKEMVESLALSTLTGGHVLIEGLPGLAKTLAVRSFAQRLAAVFSRIQFTPDLLPADLLGTRIYNAKTSEFTVAKGPLFANIVLADEVNRAPAKVQSALLQAMQERKITIGGETFELAEPFLVLATQNPVETEGTYSLPEAQVDRFLLKVVVGYPNAAEEMQILERADGLEIKDDPKPLLKPKQVLEARDEAQSLFVDDKVKRYLVDLVLATRDPKAFGLADLTTLLRFGASPRATLALASAGRAQAFLDGRGYVTPDDIKSVAHRVLRHRLALSYEAEAEGVGPDEVVTRILAKVKAP
ncbi:MAG TPA: MoxR family ATPase [bacterium]|jgi:MoxR-like ATPase|nr:MoxR family ATPase [bacterium]